VKGDIIINENLPDKRDKLKNPDIHTKLELNMEDFFNKN
jgi:hypothetical protein